VFHFWFIGFVIPIKKEKVPIRKIAEEVEAEVVV